jgi:hypothetical protein
VEREHGGVEDVGRGLGKNIDSVLDSVGGDDTLVVGLGVRGLDVTVDEGADGVLDDRVALLAVDVLADDASDADEALAWKSQRWSGAEGLP